MWKKNPGSARQLDTGSDQDGLNADDSALLEQMRQDDGSGDGDGEGEASKPQPTPAAAAAPKPGDGQPGGDGKQQEQPKPKNDSVPLATFLEQKNEVKRLEKALEESATRFNTLEARTNTILERLVPKPPEEKVPDFNEDPAAWIAHTMKATGKTLEQVQTELTALKQEKADAAKATETQNKQREQITTLISWASAQEQEFKKETADYDEAGKFLQASRQAQLEAMGLYTPQQIAQIIQNEKLHVAAAAREKGLNPAGVVYAMSKAAGYKKAEAAAGGDGKGGDGKAAAPVVSDAEKLENLRRGEQQGQSLSRAPGQGPSPMTAKRLMEMSEAEFDAFAQKNPAEFRALMGV